jgi:general secretion pathway protein A
MSTPTVYATLGLSRNPFPPTPDAGSYFFTPLLEEEFSEIVHCIEARKGFVLLTGEVGLGKSTLVRRLLDGWSPQTCRTALVLNTFLQGQALLDAVMADFGLPAVASVQAGLAALTDFLIGLHRQGQTALLVIDDAQNLDVPSLELVRLLCNLETDQEKLLQILLVGQPELEHTLALPELRQLKSRIVKHTRLRGLAPDELARYFDFRVNAAGASGRLALEPAALELLHRVTEGNLRQVHLVLDRCLYGLAGQRQTAIGTGLLRQALVDIPSLGAASPGPVPAPALRRRSTWVGGAAGALALVAAGAWVGARPLPVPAPPAPAENVAAAVVPVPARCVPAPGWRHIQAAQQATRQIQKALMARGLLEHTSPDGAFGPRTAEALARFQVQRGLPSTGLPDETTLSLLEIQDATVR